MTVASLTPFSFTRFLTNSTYLLPPASSHVQLILQGIQMDIDGIFSVTETSVYGVKSTFSFKQTSHGPFELKECCLSTPHASFVSPPFSSPL